MRVPEVCVGWHAVIGKTKSGREPRQIGLQTVGDPPPLRVWAAVQSCRIAVYAMAATTRRHYGRAFGNRKSEKQTLKFEVAMVDSEHLGFRLREAGSRMYTHLSGGVCLVLPKPVIRAWCAGCEHKGVARRVRRRALRMFPLHRLGPHDRILV